MAFNLFRWLFGKETESKKVDMKAVYYNLASEIYIRELAFNIITNKIANVLSKCEVNVYEKNKKMKNEEWYRWNIQPNKNQNATEFRNKLIYRLFHDNEALIVVNSKELYVADSFFVNDEKAFFEHTFDNVQVDNFTFGRKLTMSEVFYFKLSSSDIKSLLDSTLQLYGKLINAAYSNYLVSNGNKGMLYVDQFAEQQDDFEDTLNEMLNEDFKKFFSGSNAVMPMYQGFKYEELKNTGNQVTTRDFKALLDDVIHITANAFGVPKSIANGDVQDTSKAIDEFLTFCIDPLIELLTDEINRKLFSMFQILNGYSIKFDTKAIKHIDLLDVATAIDKLISSGCFCVNDIRRVLGEDEIDEDWANQFFMTKNYTAIEDLIKEMKGGGKDEQRKILSTQKKFRRSKS